MAAIPKKAPNGSSLLYGTHLSPNLIEKGSLPCASHNALSSLSFGYAPVIKPSAARESPVKPNASPTAALPSNTAALSPPFLYSSRTYFKAEFIIGVCSIISLIRFVGVVINGTNGRNAGTDFKAIPNLSRFDEPSNSCVQVCFLAYCKASSSIPLPFSKAISSFLLIYAALSATPACNASSKVSAYILLL